MDWEVGKDLIHLKRAIAKQVEWYFSDVNLLKDYFLLQQMDLFGAVPVSVIASFPKMLQLTQNNTDLVQQSIVEYATKVQLQQMTIRRVDSKEYMSRNQVVKLRVVQSWECIESNLISCGLWNCLLFGCFDIESNWNLVFPSEWHAKAAQYRILQMCPCITDQDVSLCSFTNDAMFSSSWQLDKEEYMEEHFQPYYYYYHHHHSMMTYSNYYPVMPIWYSSSSSPFAMEDTNVPIYSSYDNLLLYDEAMNNVPRTLQPSTDRNQSKKLNPNVLRVSNDDSAGMDKKAEKILRNTRESKQKQPRRKGKQTEKHKISNFETEDFPPLPGKNSSNVHKAKDIILAFGELRVSNYENREKQSERIGKSYANVAATFIPSVDNKNSDLSNANKERFHSYKRRQRRRERKKETIRNPSDVVAHATGKDIKGRRCRKGHKKAKEEREWSEESVIEKEEAKSLSYDDINKENAENSAVQEETLSSEEKIEKEDSTRCSLQVETLSLSESPSKDSFLARQEQTMFSDSLSPTAVDSTCWQLAQVSEPIAVVENIICDDEAKSILKVLEHLHTNNMDSKTDNSSDISFSNQLEKVSEAECNASEYVPSASVVLRNQQSIASMNASVSSTFMNIKTPLFFCQNIVSSSPLEEGLKFFAKGIS